MHKYQSTLAACEHIPIIWLPDLHSQYQERVVPSVYSNQKRYSLAEISRLWIFTPITRPPYLKYFWRWHSANRSDCRVCIGLPASVGIPQMLGFENHVPNAEVRLTQHHLFPSDTILTWEACPHFKLLLKAVVLPYVASLFPTVYPLLVVFINI